MLAPEVPRRAHFGPFELNLARRELRKYGTRIRLSEQPFQILIALVEAKGEVVTREALQARLWPSNNFGDVDHSLNVAVKRLRDVLCDSASNPRYIATVDRQGYSFIGTMEDEAWFRSDNQQKQTPTSNIARSVNPVSALEVPATERKPVAWRPTRAVAGWVALVMVLLGLATAWRTRFEESPHIVSYVQLTHSGVVHPNQKLLTDGPRLYFIERTHGKWVGKWMSVGGGPATPLNIPFELYDLQDISADGDELLVREFSG